MFPFRKEKAGRRIHMTSHNWSSVCHGSILPNSEWNVRRTGVPIRKETCAVKGASSSFGPASCPPLTTLLAQEGFCWMLSQSSFFQRWGFSCLRITSFPWYLTPSLSLGCSEPIHCVLGKSPWPVSLNPAPPPLPPIIRLSPWMLLLPVPCHKQCLLCLPGSYSFLSGCLAPSPWPLLTATSAASLLWTSSLSSFNLKPFSGLFSETL